MQKSYVTMLAVSIIACLCACSHPKTIEVAPNDPAILYTGRILWNDSTAPTFTYPGTSAAFNFQGTRLDMKASAGSGQFMVMIDENEPFKINFTDSVEQITIADSLAAGTHSAKVVYAIEGYEKHPTFLGFEITGENPQLLAAPERPELKIEFIGNSITCGYGTEADSAQVHFSYDTENHTLTYAYITGENLNADVNVVARSGIGIYRYYGGAREGTDMNMPDEYDNTLLYVPDYKWHHSSFHPDIICINLGTNDTSLDNYDISLYEKRYAEFLGHLRELHPDAKIVLLTGSMMSGKALDDVKGALDRLAASDDKVLRFDMSPQTGDLGYGADWHPSKAQHEKMACELTAFLQTIIEE